MLIAARDVFTQDRVINYLSEHIDILSLIAEHDINEEDTRSIGALLEQGFDIAKISVLYTIPHALSYYVDSDTSHAAEIATSCAEILDVGDKESFYTSPAYVSANEVGAMLLKLLIENTTTRELALSTVAGYRVVPAAVNTM